MFLAENSFMKSICLPLCFSLLVLSGCSNDNEKQPQTAPKQQAPAGQANPEPVAPEQTTSESVTTNANVAKSSVDKLGSNQVIGLYQYYADAASFTDCVTGKTYPVALEADNIALESAYSSLVEQEGQRLLVELEAEYAERPAMEGDDKEHLIPLKFIKIIHKNSCN